MKRLLRIVVLGWLWVLVLIALVVISPIALLIGYCLYPSFRECWDDYLECISFYWNKGGAFLWNG